MAAHTLLDLRRLAEFEEEVLRARVTCKLGSSGPATLGSASHSETTIDAITKRMKPIGPIWRYQSEFDDGCPEQYSSIHLSPAIAVAGEPASHKGTKKLGFSNPSILRTNAHRPIQVILYVSSGQMNVRPL